MSDMIWNFTMSSHNQFTGFNGTGIDVFVDDPYKNMVREMLQNSLDARLEDKQAYVEIVAGTFEPKSLLGYDSLLTTFEDWKNDLKQQKAVDEKEIEFVKKANNQMKAPLSAYLRISDHNTKGMEGSSDPENGDTPWFAFTKGSGKNNKSILSAGSKGIGKNAAFAVSNLHTIYVSSYSAKTGEKGSLGIAKLSSINKKLNDGTSDYTQGTGYCIKNTKEDIKYNRPFDGLITIPECSSREEGDTGTDIFVPAFSGFYQDWEHQMIEEAIVSFMPAIINKELKVLIKGKMENQLIDDEHIDAIIRECRGFDKKYIQVAKSLYEVLINPKTIVEKYNKPGFEMTMLILPGAEYASDCVYCFRAPIKMKICSITPDSNVEYSAILMVEGDEICQRLKSVEDVKHIKWSKTAWENTKYDKNQIKEAIDAVYIFANMVLEKFNNGEAGDASDFKWAVEEGWTVEEKDIDNEESGEAGLALVDIEFNSRSQKQKKPKKEISRHIDDPEGLADSFDLVTANSEGEDIIGSKPINFTDDPVGPNPNPHPNPHEPEPLFVGENGSDSIVVRKSIKVLKSQIKSVNPKEGKMILSFIPQISGKDAHLELIKAAIYNDGERTRIKNAIMNDTQLLIDGNKICLGDIEKNILYTINIQTIEKRNYIWEVNLDAIK